MKPWSKLQKAIKNLFAPNIPLDIQCRVIRMSSQRGSTNLPRYWITLGKETIWDYPGDFKELATEYPYITDISEISCLIRDYIDTPVAELFSRTFDDRWGLIDILLAADRRLGKRSKEQILECINHPAAKQIVENRWLAKAKQKVPS